MTKRPLSGRLTRLTSAVVVGAFALGLAACGSSDDSNGGAAVSDASSGGSEVSDGSSGGSEVSDLLTVAVGAAPLSLDPATNNNSPDSTMYMDLAYEPLINLESDGSLSPGLATSWDYTDEEMKVFELELRPDVKFSDGAPLDANAVVASIEHEKTANGPVAVYANEIESVEAVDSDTVRLNLVRSNPTIAFLLTQRFLIGSIVGPGGLADLDALGNSTNGAGQYMLDPGETVANDHYTFVPNPFYYDKSRVHFKKVVVRVISNPQTALSALSSGQIDYTHGAFATAAQAKSEGLKVYSAESGWHAAFLFDRNGEVVPALKEQKVRQALNFAIDRVAIVNALFGDDYGSPGSQISIAGYEGIGFVPDINDLYNYDPDKARQLLTEAGFPDGFSMTIGASPQYANGVEMAQAIAGYWEEIGVTTKIETFAAVGDMVEPWLAKELPAVTGNYDAQPMFILIGQALAKNAGIFNPFETEDAELNSLIDKAYAETDPDKQPAAWDAIMRRVVDLAWFVPVGAGALLYYGSEDLQGVELSPTAFVPDPTRFHF